MRPKRYFRSTTPPPFARDDTRHANPFFFLSSSSSVVTRNLFQVNLLVFFPPQFMWGWDFFFFSNRFQNAAKWSRLVSLANAEERGGLVEGVAQESWHREAKHWDGGGKTFSPVEGAKDRTRKVEPRCFKLAFRGSERKLEDRWWLFQQYSHQLAKCFSLFNFDLLLFNSPMLHPLRGISFSPFSACNSREAIQSVSLSREFWFSGWLAHSQTHGIASSPSFRNYWHTQNHFPP